MIHDFKENMPIETAVKAQNHGLIMLYLLGHPNAICLIYPETYKAIITDSRIPGTY